MLFLFKKLLIESDTRGNKFCNSTFYDAFCQLRILKLITDSYFVACAHQFGKICLQRMVRKSRHRDSTRCRAGALCKDDAEHLAGGQGIIAICFVKIAAPEQKHCLRILCLEGKILLHHRCFGRFLFCHFRLVYN